MALSSSYPVWWLGGREEPVVAHGVYVLLPLSTATLHRSLLRPKELEMA